MAGRNAGTGTRDMCAAGRIILNREAERGNLSFSTAGSVHSAWKLFVDFAHSQNVKRMEHVTSELVKAYGKSLTDQVRLGDCSSSYAQRLISAVNSVMTLSRSDWRVIKAVTDCKLPKRRSVRDREPGGMDPSIINQLTKELDLVGLARASAVVQLTWTFGLRIKEAALLDVRKALVEANTSGWITINAGTKGGRKRNVPVIHAYQFQTLRETSVLQGSARSVMQSDIDWKTFLNEELRKARRILKAHNIKCYHELRAAYACRRYNEITGHPAPVINGRVEDIVLDRSARKKITNELGHNRLSVTTAYIGSMR
jgi:site-specific recombinase XerD